MTNGLRACSIYRTETGMRFCSDFRCFANPTITRSRSATTSLPLSLSGVETAGRANDGRSLRTRRRRRRRLAAPGTVTFVGRPMRRMPSPASIATPSPSITEASRSSSACSGNSGYDAASGSVSSNRGNMGFIGPHPHTPPGSAKPRDASRACRRGRGRFGAHSHEHHEDREGRSRWLRV